MGGRTIGGGHSRRPGRKWAIKRSAAQCSAARFRIGGKMAGDFRAFLGSEALLVLAVFASLVFDARIALIHSA
jgi:hypothetical protein